MQEETNFVHHEFSPSKLQRFENCPAAYKVCKDMLEVKGAASTRGTLLHRAIYDDSVRGQVSDADWETVERIRQEHEEYNKYEVFHEIYLEVRDENGELLSYGIADYLVIDRERAVALLKDFKFGANSVPQPVDNPQLQTYVVGVFQKFPEIQTVYTNIVQPMLPEDFYEEALYRRESIGAIINRLKTIIARAKCADLEDPLSYNVNIDADSESNCRYCNKLNCKAYLEKIKQCFSLLSIDHDAIPLKEVQETVEYADRIKTAWKTISDNVDEVLKQADRIILEAGGSEHFKVCDGKKMTKTDWQALCADHNITDADLEQYRTYSLSKPSLMSKVRKKRVKADAIGIPTLKSLE